MIRRAYLSDLDAIAAIYFEVHTEIEAGRASIGWQRGIYPERCHAEDAIRRRDMFVLEEAGSILACGRINRYQGPEYDSAVWSFDADPDEVMVLHTLVVRPNAKGRGYGTAFVRFYEDFARQHGCTALRLDTNVINLAARRLYQRLGYREACVVRTPFNGLDEISLVCLDKPL